MFSLCVVVVGMLDWGGSQYPLLPGHEVIGKITALGPNVQVSCPSSNLLSSVGCVVGLEFEDRRSRRHWTYGEFMKNTLREFKSHRLVVVCWVPVTTAKLGNIICVRKAWDVTIPWIILALARMEV